MSHTPAPWWVDVHKNVMASGGMVAFPCISAGFDQDANARLIASAPAMLEALEELLASDRADQNAIAGRDVDGHPLNAAGVARMNARAVIRAAKGEA